MGMEHQHIQSRYIGTFTTGRPGPLVIALGAVHGNEPAGVQALHEVFALLEAETSIYPGFQFNGKLVGLIGNLAAYATRQRFIERDLNRMWLSEVVHQVMQRPQESLEAEWREMAELVTAIRHEIETTQPEKVVIIDLHTTSAAGGIFTIPLDFDPESVRLARALHAPVINGLLKGLDGTMLHFAAAHGFSDCHMPDRTVSVAFEAGQHDDPLSVSRAISATISALRATGCIRARDVDTRHDAILKQYAKRLPKVTTIRHVHHIQPDDNFKMRPGYVNFQRITAGEHLADDRQGRITAPQDGLILMPLYQPKGADGFFVVEEE
jgi:succinylglutamate desuccinylase